MKEFLIHAAKSFVEGWPFIWPVMMLSALTHISRQLAGIAELIERNRD